MARVVPPTEAYLDEAASILSSGGLVGLPTETVYGLAARTLDPAAIAGIYAAKERPSFNPLIAHVHRTLASLSALAEAGIVDVERLTPTAREIARRLLEGGFPGPLTLVLPRGPAIPDLPAAGLDTIGVRCPDHPVAQALLARVAGPLSAPSANRSGRLSPTTGQDVADDLGDRLDLILDGGRCRVGLESTVVHLSGVGDVTLLRPGSIPRSQISVWTGCPVHSALESTNTPRSPGMTSTHYAPTSVLVPLPGQYPALPHEHRLLYPRSTPILCWTMADALAVRALGLRAASLTEDGDPQEAARRLFSTLRELDRSASGMILVEPCPPGEPQDGLEFAIADRLRRAGGRAP